MSFRMQMRLVPALALALLAGCAASRGSAAPREGAVLEVDNRGFSDMTIYAVDGTARRRLGFAPGNSRTQLSIPATLSNRDLAILADPVGSNRTSVSNRIYVRAGETVTLTINP